jgi:hypothetical protein
MTEKQVKSIKEKLDADESLEGMDLDGTKSTRCYWLYWLNAAIESLPGKGNDPLSKQTFLYK